MGPEATVRFFDNIVKLTPASKDQDHFQIIIINNPQIPDRTASVMNNEESPVPSVKECIITLENIGVDIIAIPCVSIHYYYDEFKVISKKKILNIIEATINKTLNAVLEIKKIGIMGTDLTVYTKIFEHCINDNNVNFIYPNMNDQKFLVMKSIYEIKRGDYDSAKKNLIKAANLLKHQGAEAIILGCTEIPLVLDKSDIDVPLIDTIECLAEAVIKEALTIK